MNKPLRFTADLIARAQRITTLVIDVDGVLTDGGLIYAEHGDELKSFHVRDGAGMVFWNRQGFKSVIITGRKSNLLKRRAKELRADVLIQGALLKLPAYERVRKRLRVKDEEVCAIGDDLMELPILRRVGLAVAVSDAVEEVRNASHYVAARAGGHGAVREVIEEILKAKGLWEDVLERYYI